MTTAGASGTYMTQTCSAKERLGLTEDTTLLMGNRNPLKISDMRRLHYFVIITLLEKGVYIKLMARESLRLSVFCKN